MVALYGYSSLINTSPCQLATTSCRSTAEAPQSACIADAELVPSGSLRTIHASPGQLGQRETMIARRTDVDVIKNLMAGALTVVLLTACGSAESECARGWAYTLHSAVEKLDLAKTSEATAIDGRSCISGTLKGQPVEVCEFEHEDARGTYLDQRQDTSTDPIMFKAPQPFTILTTDAKTSDTITGTLFEGC